MLVERGGLLALVVLVAYAWAAPTHVVDGDNAELSTLGQLGGAAHPTGYPAYLVWLRLWSWLPAASQAHRAALATALLGALGAWALHAACRAWGARPLAATAAVAIYAAGPAVLRVATEAEVFALNQLVIALVLWLAARGGPARGAWRVALLGLVAGVGIADHVTCVLVAPVGLLGAVRGVREAGARAAGAKLRAIAGGVAGLAIGLSLYAYLLVTSPNPCSWGSIDSLYDLGRHFLREDFGGPGAFSPQGGAVDVPANVGAWLFTFVRGWAYVPALAGVAWLARACVRASQGDRDETAWAWRWLAVALVLAGPMLTLRFDIPPAGLGLYVVRRFHLMSLVMIAPAVAVAFDRAAAWLAARSRVSARLASPVAHLVFVVAFAPSLLEVSAAHSPADELGVRNLLRSLPQGAVVIQAKSEIYFGAAYLQQIEGVRPDVTIVTWPMVPFPWYRERLAARGVDVRADGDEASSVRAAEYLLGEGKPVFVDQLEANILSEYPSYPYGIVFRVLPKGASVPTVEQAFAINEHVFDDLYEAPDYTLPGPGDEFATSMHERYANVWQILREAVRAKGEDDAVELADLELQRWGLRE
jgi:hypothetical protein